MAYIQTFGVRCSSVPPSRRFCGGGWRPQQGPHRLVIDGVQSVSRQSVQYLVEFLQGDTHDVTELVLIFVVLAQPSDGGIDVLRSLFAAPTTLTKITLDNHCNFGSGQDASQLIAALQTNPLVTNLTIADINHLHGVALGNCISRVLQNHTTLQRLE
jgi:hypothetical protein